MLIESTYLCDICGAKYTAGHTGSITVTSWAGIEISSDVCPVCHTNVTKALQALIDDAKARVA